MRPLPQHASTQHTQKTPSTHTINTHPTHTHNLPALNTHNQPALNPHNQPTLNPHSRHNLFINSNCVIPSVVCSFSTSNYCCLYPIPRTVLPVPMPRFHSHQAHRNFEHLDLNRKATLSLLEHYHQREHWPAHSTSTWYDTGTTRVAVLCILQSRCAMDLQSLRA